MNIPYEKFYWLYGIRQLSHLMSPRTFDINEFRFPIGSLHHYLDLDGTNDFPLETMWMYQGQTKRMGLENITELKDPIGTPITKMSGIAAIVQSHFSSHKLFRRAELVAGAKDDPITPHVVNYGLLNNVAKYQTTQLSDWHEWFNIEKTVWHRAKEIANFSQRQHFYFLEVPTVLPSLRTLDFFKKTVNKNLMAVLDTPAKRFILELFKLNDKEFSNGVFDGWGMKELNKVNIVLHYKSRWCVVNLGLLFSLNNNFQDKEAVRSDKLSLGSQTFDPVKMKKVILTFLLKVQASFASYDTKDVIEDTETDTVKDGTDDYSGIDDTPEDTEAKTNTQQNTPTDTDEFTEIEDRQNEDTTEVNIDEAMKDIESSESKLLIANHISDLDKETPTIKTTPTNTLTLTQVKEMVYEDIDANTVLKKRIDELADYGVMSSSEYRSLQKYASKVEEMYDPINGKIPLKDYVKVDPTLLQITPEETALPDSKGVLDKSMLGDTVSVFNKKYLKEVLPRDISAMVLNLQKAGVIVMDYNIDLKPAITGDVTEITLQLKPIDGQASTIKVRLPTVDEEGNFYCNGIKNRMRSQIVDNPIRKVGPDRVALSSYYGKAFVMKSIKRSTNPSIWLYTQLSAINANPELKQVREMAVANVFDNNFIAPAIYTALAQHIKSIVIGGHYFNFDHLDREKLFDPAALQKAEQKGYVACGFTKHKEIIVVGEDDGFYVFDGKEYRFLGDIYSLSLIDASKAPIDYSSLKVFTKTIPVGVVLGFYIGWENLLTLLNVEYTKIETGKRIVLHQDQYEIRFKDVKYLFSRKDKRASMILGGFREYKDIVKRHQVEEFNTQGIYFSLLEGAGLGARYGDELKNLDDLFVDPITKDVLESLHEPVTFRGLLVRASELLLVDYHPDSIGVKDGRFRGYERLAGFMYKEISQSIREYKRKNIRGRGKIEMSPFAVWQAVVSDNTTKPPNDINPLQDLKEQEAVTYVGEGGRSKDGMNKITRTYQPGDMGTISEATVDSSDVGINLFFSANPKLKNLRGIPEVGFELEKDGAGRLLGSSVLLAPGAVHDDVKRALFISIQHGHTVACEGYRQPYVRTGYELVLPHRTSSLFSYTAEQDGVVKEIEAGKGVVVEYADGTIAHVELGRRYGRAEGSIYAHDIVSPLSVKDKFKRGDPIAYNTGFFEPDFFNPKQIIWKSGLYVKTMLVETTETFEDSSIISKKISSQLTTTSIKERKFVVTFKQGVRDVKKPGSAVDTNTILMIIEDEITADTGMFDTETLAALQRLSNKAPKAKVIGKIDRIEVYYHGDKDDMSPSLRALANQSDKELGAKAKLLNKPHVTGRVTGEYSVDGKPLMLDHAEIKIYLEYQTDAGVGDKGVFANQMKSVFGGVYNYRLMSEDGDEIDAKFSNNSIAKRIVLSPYKIGTTATLLKHAAKFAINLYRTGKPK